MSGGVRFPQSLPLATSWPHVHGAQAHSEVQATFLSGVHLGANPSPPQPSPGAGHTQDLHNGGQDTPEVMPSREKTAATQLALANCTGLGQAMIQERSPLGVIC